MIRDERGRKWPVWKLKAVLCCGSGKRRSQLSGEIQQTESRGKVRLGFFQGAVTGNCSKSSAMPFFSTPSSSSAQRRGIALGICVLVQQFHSLDQVLCESQEQVMLEHSIYFKLPEKLLLDPVFITSRTLEILNKRLC